MGKFAGFLKRAKNLVNTVAKGIKTVKGIWNNWITKPGVGLINMLVPGSNNLTDQLFKIDNYVNKGIDWVIDKTGNKKQIKIDNTNDFMNEIKSTICTYWSRRC
jgi:hypothetical protein